MKSVGEALRGSVNELDKKTKQKRKDF